MQETTISMVVAICLTMNNNGSKSLSYIKKLDHYNCSVI